MESFKKYVAEFIGTMVLVIFGCGVAAVSGCSGASFDAAYIGTAIAFGLVIVAMAYSVGVVSGCHINPAVSLAMLISKRMSVKDFIGYVAAQFLGGLAGAGFLCLVLYSPANLGQNGLYNGDPVISILVELVLTAVFVFVILAVTSKNGLGSFAGLAIGGALTLVHLFGIHFTGTSVNPARSLGPAFFSCTLNAMPVFIIGPFAGAVIAALVWKLVSTEK